MSDISYTPNELATTNLNGQQPLIYYLNNEKQYMVQSTLMDYLEELMEVATMNLTTIYKNNSTKIKKGQIEFKGVKDSSIDFLGFKVTNYTKETKVSKWKDLLALWKNKIDLLANEFLSGRAVIEPTLNQETCKNCDLNSLCRIRECDFENDEEEV